MTIPFKNIPANVRTPLFYAELDNSQANTAAQSQRTLIIAQMTQVGTATPNVPVKAFGQARALGGAGSVLALMAAVYGANDPTGDVWLLPLADDASATAATGTLTFTGPTTAAGILSLYIGASPLNPSVVGLPQALAIPLATAQTAAQVATTVAALINSAIDLPVTASAAASVVTLTAKNKGLCGNDIGIAANFRGAIMGEALPAGLGVAIVPMSGGTINPTLTTALASLTDMPFDFIVMGVNDPTSATAIKAFLNDSTGRWSWSKQLFGHAFYGFTGTQGAAASYAAAMNDQHALVLPQQGSPTPSWLWIAWAVGLAAPSLRADPGLPLQTLSGTGVLAPPIASRFDITIRNMLLYSGCSTFTVDTTGTVALERMITTYVTNPQGQPDNSYLKLTTMFLLMYAIRRMRDMVQRKYARRKLAASGTRALPGTNVVTPNTIRADIIAEYRAMEADGFVQGSDTFAANLVVEKNAGNPDRVDVLYPAIFVDELDVLAMLVQFRQQ
jgi:phage tail sheath gpL-like